MWLEGLDGTLVVSPVCKAMDWSGAERVRTRSVVGRRYAPITTGSLPLWALFAALDGALTRTGAVGSSGSPCECPV